MRKDSRWLVMLDLLVYTIVNNAISAEIEKRKDFIEKKIARLYTENYYEQNQEESSSLMMIYYNELAPPLSAFPTTFLNIAQQET